MREWDFLLAKGLLILDMLVFPDESQSKSALSLLVPQPDSICNPSLHTVGNVISGMFWGKRMQATCSCSMALLYLKSKENSQQEGTGDEWEMGSSMASKFPCMSLHLRQRGPGSRALSCHCEHSGDA